VNPNNPYNPYAPQQGSQPIQGGQPNVTVAGAQQSVNQALYNGQQSANQAQQQPQYRQPQPQYRQPVQDMQRPAPQQQPQVNTAQFFQPSQPQQQFQNPPLQPQFSQQGQPQPNMMQGYARPQLSSEQAAMAQILSTPLAPEKRSLKMPIIIASSVIGFILVIVGLFVFISSSSKSNKISDKGIITNQTKPTDTPTTNVSTAYTSPDGAFSINFATTPELQTSNVKVGETDVPYNLYTQSNDTST
jgi:hypothetical protein